VLAPDTGSPDDANNGAKQETDCEDGEPLMARKYLAQGCTKKCASQRATESDLEPANNFKNYVYDLHFFSIILKLSAMCPGKGLQCPNEFNKSLYENKWAWYSQALNELSF
jgi:hypothetical protein